MKHIVMLRKTCSLPKCRELWRDIHYLPFTCWLCQKTRQNYNIDASYCNISQISRPQPRQLGWRETVEVFGQSGTLHEVITPLGCKWGDGQILSDGVAKGFGNCLPKISIKRKSEPVYICHVYIRRSSSL